MLHSLMPPSSELHFPHLVQSPISSTQSVGNASMASPMMSRFSSSAKRFTKDLASGLKNVDIISGLAYYAQAMNILRNCYGRNDLARVQTNLLADLYVGQLAWGFQSWS